MGEGEVVEVVEVLEVVVVVVMVITLVMMPRARMYILVLSTRMTERGR